MASKPVCANCDQWVHEHGDCMNDCAERGLVPCECGGDGCFECMGEPPDGPFDTTQERVDFYA